MHWANVATPTVLHDKTVQYSPSGKERKKVHCRISRSTAICIFDKDWGAEEYTIKYMSNASVDLAVDDGQVL